MTNDVVPSPLVVTAAIGQADAAYFDRLRDRYFPPERNFLKAHITMFHRLPGTQEAAVARMIHRTAIQNMAIKVRVTSLRSLGRGVAFELDGFELKALRGRLALAFEQWLTPQDRQRWKPHITIQNKVAPEKATALHRHLSSNFVPFDITIEGVGLWRYVGGPWENVETLKFGGL